MRRDPRQLEAAYVFIGRTGQKNGPSRGRMWQRGSAGGKGGLSCGGAETLGSRSGNSLKWGDKKGRT